MQLYHYELDDGQCEVSTPSDELANFVDYYWLLSIGDADVNLDVIPDLATDLVMCPTQPSFAALFLPVDTIVSIPLSGPIQYVGICFRSGRFSDLFESDASLLRELNAGPATIKALGVASLVDAIQGLTSMKQFTTRFNQYWRERLTALQVKTLPTHRLNEEEILNAITASLGQHGIESVCSTLGVSDRQFRRLSQDMLGITPKKIQSILRLKAALSDLFAVDEPQIEDLYYDDSHRIRELKKLTGFTPMQIRQMAEKYNRR